VRTVLVVMPDVSALHLLQVAMADDQEPVEAFAPQVSLRVSKLGFRAELRF
jgi:hypothetical protein